MHTLWLEFGYHTQIALAFSYFPLLFIGFEGCALSTKLEKYMYIQNLYERK